MSEKSPRNRVIVGYVVFGVLVASKVAEYLLARNVHSGSWPYLAILALFGAWLILVFFMHFWHVLGGERDEDE